MLGQMVPSHTMDYLLNARRVSLHTLEIPVPRLSQVYEFFAGLSPELRRDLCSEHHYLPGEVIFAEGELGDALYVIWTGRVAVIKGGWDRPTILAYRGLGEIIGEMALLENQPRSASVVALEPTHLLRVDRASFEYLLAYNPAVAMGIMATLSARLRLADHARDIQAQVENQLIRELEAAGEVQARFLPEAVPTVPGWGIAAGLVPVWQTSGDYYDFVEFSPDRLGVLIADVTDKGVGAALYMAMSRTLIRAYALQYPDDPARVLVAANERIVSDTHSDQFVTMFYGVLDLPSGRLVYANAGHNPPLVVRARPDLPPEELHKTGIPLGMFDGADWEQLGTLLEPGDRLVLYTDGVSDARNPRREEYGMGRLAAAAQAVRGLPVHQAHAALMVGVQDFIGTAPQFDDITLLVVGRE